MVRLGQLIFITGQVFSWYGHFKQQPLQCITFIINSISTKRAGDELLHGEISLNTPFQRTQNDCIVQENTMETLHGVTN